ncbi:MAG: phosphoadenosine phosphosulfate reductase family protein, partial [Acidimicrobiales bacterium]
MVPAPTLTDDDLDVLSRRFGRAHPEAVITWAVEQFHPRLVLATSMTDAVLVDLAVRVEPAIEVVFIDTGYHFPETLATVDAVRRRYGLNLKVMRAPEPAVPLWQADPEHCCASLKVALLDDALAGREAWMSGLRRAESPTRAAAPIVSRDHRGLVKVNPLATWD